MLLALIFAAAAKDEASFDMDAPPPATAESPVDNAEKSGGDATLAANPSSGAASDDAFDMDSGVGMLAPSQISAVLKKNSYAVQDCVSRYGGSNPRGRMLVSWEITEEGRAINVTSSESTVGNPTLEGCIVSSVRRLKFPAPEGGTVKTSHPFVLN